MTTKRPTFGEVVAAVEKVKGRSWTEFRDEYGDSGREMVLYLGRRLCGMKLMELAKEAGMANFGMVATNARRYELRLKADRAERTRLNQVLKLFNCEM